ncbi:phosphopantetheine-binding protein [Mycobacterium sp. HUMS_1102779]|uniref:phosphopantetheine-binding protein n=1 Tax=Mycobacterium sp. HUMS_1102779 TaxID=3383487 RepID=UPI00389AAC63
MKADGRAAPVLALVRGLVTEVHPHAAAPTVTLDSSFENLGIGSLELGELLLRIQDTFGVALPEHLLADHLRRTTGILANARAAMLVTVPEALTLGHLLRANVASMRHVVVPETLMAASEDTLP